MTAIALEAPPTTYQELVAAQVRAEVARVKLSGRAIASALGVDPSYVSRRMTGHTPFTPDELAMIAMLLHVPVSALLPEPSVDLHYCINSLGLDFEPDETPESD